MFHLEQPKIFTNLNHSFRSGLSTETHLLTTTNDLRMSFDKGKQVDMTILDFSNAFDIVPHDCLLHKLTTYGVTGTLHTLLTCFLTVQVVVEGTSSSVTTVDSECHRAQYLAPSYSCAISLIYWRQSNHKYAYLQMTASSTGRSMTSKTTTLYKKTSTHYSHGLEPWTDR